MSLSQTIFGISFDNPLLTASGKWAWTAEQCQKALDGGAGGITTKSFSTLTRSGHPDPTVFHADHYTLNAVGLPSEGFDAVEDDLGPFVSDRSAPVIVSIFGESVERFGEAANAFAALGADALELNISCPNVQDEHGLPFSYAPNTAAAAVKAAKDAAPGMRMLAKLSANASDIKSVAVACAEAGIDGFTLINTVGPGMVIDLVTRRPVLSNKTGGVSGPGIKPVAVRCVSDVYSATNGKLPIIGVGGVMTGEDAIEMMMAGASLVGIGTAVLTNGYDVFRRITGEMKLWCEREGVMSAASLTGAIHAKN